MAMAARGGEGASTPNHAAAKEGDGQGEEEGEAISAGDAEGRQCPWEREGLLCRAYLVASQLQAETDAVAASATPPNTEAVGGSGAEDSGLGEEATSPLTISSGSCVVPDATVQQVCPVHALWTLDTRPTAPHILQPYCEQYIRASI